MRIEFELCVNPAFVNDSVDILSIQAKKSIFMTFLG